MKQLTLFVYVSLITIFLLTSCKKEKTNIPLPGITVPLPDSNINRQPIAKAGADVSISPHSCVDRWAFAVLNGSSSTDPDNNIISYNWKGISGPIGYILKDSNSVKATVENFSVGKYSFELTVRDAGGLSSRDTMEISITATPGIAIGYDLDLTVSTKYVSLDNFSDPWDYDTGYSDYTYMTGKTVIQPMGEFEIFVTEYADTSALSDQLYSDGLSIMTTNTNSQAIYIGGGLSGINFKKLMRKGGGSFNGFLKVTGGSAEYCDANVVANLPALSVSGELDVASSTVTMRIQGKVYF